MLLKRVGEDPPADDFFRVDERIARRFLEKRGGVIRYESFPQSLVAVVQFEEVNGEKRETRLQARTIAPSLPWIPRLVSAIRHLREVRLREAGSRLGPDEIEILVPYPPMIERESHLLEFMFGSIQKALSDNRQGIDIEQITFAVFSSKGGTEKVILYPFRQVRNLEGVGTGEFELASKRKKSLRGEEERLLSLADQQMQERQWLEAEQSLRSLLMRSLRNRVRAEALRMLGVSLRKMERWPEAVEVHREAYSLTQAPALLKEIAVDYLEWGVQCPADHASGLFREGLATIEQFFAKGSERDVSGWTIKAELLRRLDRFDEALVAVDRAIQLRPSEGRICRKRGEILVRRNGQGDLEEAVKSFRLGIERTPRDERGKRTLQSLYAALLSLLVRMNRQDEAAGCAEKARSAGVEPGLVQAILDGRARKI